MSHPFDSPGGKLSNCWQSMGSDVAYQTSEELPGMILGYQNCRNIIVEGLQAQALEWSIEPPKATLYICYIWVPVPKGYTLTEFVTLLLEKCGLIVPLETGMILLGKAFGLPSPW